jgi:hypothetical protein
MTTPPTPNGQFVTATYQVPIENQAAFVDVLKEAEGVMRGAGLITVWPAVRMRSKKQPDLILELFQWTDDTSFDKAQETPAVLELWGQLEGLWTDGGFGVDRFPESGDFWAQYDSITP